VSERDDELLRHLGTLWRSAMVGLDTLREVAVRSTQTGRLRVDIALLQRERSQLLETLGEMVVAMIDDGSFEDVPESIKQAYDRIKDVDGRIKSDDAKAHDNAFGAPRGFEPEAASDYGDEATHPGDDDDEHEDEAPRRSRSTSGGGGGGGPRKRTPNGRRKVTSR
jgi:hypothetical protein